MSHVLPLCFQTNEETRLVISKALDCLIATKRPTSCGGDWDTLVYFCTNCSMFKLFMFFGGYLLITLVKRCEAMTCDLACFSRAIPLMHLLAIDFEELGDFPSLPLKWLAIFKVRSTTFPMSTWLSCSHINMYPTIAIIDEPSLLYSVN